MATTFKQVVTSVTAPTITLNSAGSGTYAVSTAYNNTTNQPLDLLVDLAITPGTVAGNKQAVLFALASLDNTNFQTGSNSTDEADMTLIGVLPLNSNATLQRKQFSVAQAYGGVLPPYIKFVVKNDTGVAFAASGNSLALSEISGQAV